MKIATDFIMLSLKKKTISKPTVIIETWDELVALADKAPEPPPPPIMATGANIVIKAMQWHRYTIILEYI